MNKKSLISVAIVMALFTGCSFALFMSCTPASNTQKLTSYVNPFLGTTTLWDTVDLKYKPTRRAWGAECYPGATLPHGMVQATPVTMYGSGSGYQYEDPNIYAFFHSSKGQWGQGHVPLLPFTGQITADDHHSGYSHANESAKVGYYQVFLERYGINAEMTATMRCAYHRFTYRDGDDKKLFLNLARTNRGRTGIVWSRWTFKQENDRIFSGSQASSDGQYYFYAVVNHTIQSIDSMKSVKNENEVLTILNFSGGKEPLELKIGFSLVSVDKAKKNLEAEMIHKSFAQVVEEADRTWEELLSKIQVTGGTEKQKVTFYSCLYRALQWPPVRNDVDGEFIHPNGQVVNLGFNFYGNNNIWDAGRNKTTLMSMVEPEVTSDVIKSDIERAKVSGFFARGFHGDWNLPFVTGSYLRGIRGFDVDTAYYYMMRNAFVPGDARNGRQYLDEYMERGWIAENRVKNPTTRTEVDEAKAAVMKTLEFAYSDYAAALMAKEMGDMDKYNHLLQRSRNYKNAFDPSTGFMRGMWDNGEWITPFYPDYPYYVYMYREANGWEMTFFAPHDPHGLIGLFPSKEAFELKLDSLFTVPWGGYEAANFTGFLGQYCHGNQPSHGATHMYYFIDKQEKAQEKIDIVMEDLYNMGKEGLAYAGMDDDGGLSAWYVLSAIGLYNFSPADPEYLVSVPIFDKVVFTMGDAQFTIRREGSGRKISHITYDGQKINGYFISHDDLKRGKELVITTE